jgi:hypothetical protein
MVASILIVARMVTFFATLLCNPHISPSHSLREPPDFGCHHEGGNSAFIGNVGTHLCNSL